MRLVGPCRGAGARALAGLVLGVLAHSACGGAVNDETLFWPSSTWTDAAEGDGGDPDAGADAPARDAPAEPARREASSSTACLTVSVTTQTAYGDYAPRNIGAIWIADRDGGLVKTLVLWARTRIRQLVQWNAAARSAGVAPGFRWPPLPAAVDAVTGATAYGYATPHVGTWNCTDFREAPVPDGSYQLCMEMTESDWSSEVQCLDLEVGASAYTLTPDDQPSFVDVTADYQPVGSR
jgi:hypothetical protein